VPDEIADDFDLIRVVSENSKPRNSSSISISNSSRPRESRSKSLLKCTSSVTSSASIPRYLAMSVRTSLASKSNCGGARGSIVSPISPKTGNRQTNKIGGETPVHPWRSRRRSASASTRCSPPPNPMVSAGVIGRRPSWTRKSQALDLAAIRLGARRILAETLRQRGNREVTNKQFGARFLCFVPSSA
jgi:hypothetical protein